ncbi:MAG TPA: hydrogenase maturation nickel metallochaperone HypA [Bryobacteraceae bacterium]|nr:hydrogenase maturation nickel metallochaperone HypA [Bryobacteraceae bacterium]
MHEMSIASSVLEAVRGESLRRGGSRVRAVGLRIGALSGVDPESLRFSWDVLVSGTDLDPLPLEIEFRPWSNRCRVCGRSFPVENYNVTCPGCGSTETEPAGGHELDLAWLEVEEDEPRTAGTQSPD